MGQINEADMGVSPVMLPPLFSEPFLNLRGRAWRAKISSPYGPADLYRGLSDLLGSAGPSRPLKVSQKERVRRALPTALKRYWISYCKRMERVQVWMLML